MSKMIYVIILVMGIGILNAEDNTNGIIQNSTSLVWPSAPDEARIEYKYSIEKSSDIGIEKSFFSKVYDFLFGEEEAVLSAPFGVYADNNRIYTTDIASKTVYVFDKKENESFTIEGSDKEHFLYPIDVVADANGNIYVSDSVRVKIYVFDADGDFQYTIVPKKLQRCVGIAIGESNNLYIADALADQIHVTSLQGKYLYSIGTIGTEEGEFNKPTFIAADNGNIYVSDSMNHRVQILSEKGEFIHSFGQLGQNIGDFASPRGIALDSEGNIYVTDTMFNNIQIFNQKGELLLVVGHYGARAGEFALPEDITILEDGSIYISDTNNRRIQVLKKLEIKEGV